MNPNQHPDATQEVVPTADGFTIVPAMAEAAPRTPELANELAGLYRTDDVLDPSPLAYHFIVMHEGKRVFFRELDEPGLEDYFDKQNAITDRNKTMRTTPNAYGAEKQARALLNEQRVLALEVLQKTLVAWELALPQRAPERLTMTVRVKLAAAAVKGSSMGGDAGPFVDGS